LFPCSWNGGLEHKRGMMFKVSAGTRRFSPSLCCSFPWSSSLSSPTKKLGLGARTVSVSGPKIRRCQETKPDRALEGNQITPTQLRCGARHFGSLERKTT
jgi:hypothetical protein